MLFLHLARGARERIIALTEKSMYDWCKNQEELGRTPAGIAFQLVELEPDLRRRLEMSRRRASKEVSRRPTDSVHRIRK